MKTRITCKAYFDAAHRMSPAPEEGYDRWHGHRYEVEVTANTYVWSHLPLDDFRKGVAEVLSAYDHRTLTWIGDAEGCKINEAVVFPSQPTMETIARAIYAQMHSWIEEHSKAKLYSVRVSSQPDAYAVVFNDCDA